jgi:uncharacterized protein
MTQELVVTGDGAASGTPDRCVITLALNVMADTSADALDRVGALAEQVLGVVLDQGIERSNVQTLNVSLQDWFDRENQTVTARVAQYSLAVSLSGLEKAGPLLAVVAPIAGNALQVQGLRLSVADTTPLLLQARRAAVEDAMGKARELAVAAGVRLGKITSIDDRGSSGSGRVQYRAYAASSSIPMEAGTSEVTAQVTIAFEIES